ncbi:ABC-type xenobiotic transporter [Ranunculus cassubicifolius]
MADENGWRSQSKALRSESDINSTNETSENKQDEQDSKNSKEEEETVKTVPFYKLFSFVDSKDICLMVIGTIAAVANGMSSPLMTLFLGDAIDAFGKNENNDNTLHAVTKISLRFVYLAIGSGLASTLQVACWMITGERQAARMRSLYLQTILRQDVAFFDKETNTGEVIGRMSGDTVLIQSAMGFIIAFIKGWLLALVMLSCIPPLVICGAVMSRILTKMSSRGQASYSQAGVVVEQTIGSIRTVASFTGERHAITHYDKTLNNAYKSGVQTGIASGLGIGVTLFIMFCTYALAIWYGGKMIIEKGYSGGEVINIILAILNGSMSLGQASPTLTAFATGQAAAFKMFETINRKPEIDSYDMKGLILDELRGDIELRDVCFSYPARPDEQVFNGFCLSIPWGTTSALVGQSGSGKSTVISLIERFYDPQAGDVFIDGKNLKEFQLRWIREKIGLVSQEPVLFSSSIKENIAYGKDGATIEEIKAAAELANAAKFIDKLPQGLDTLVGEHGTQLSGGQKQRVAIARAILKDPRILLLDEATSALDAESERVVQDALDRIMVNRTTVIVAHRLSTIRNADMIAVVHRGKIVEKGSHSELLKIPNGTYSELVHLQEVNRNVEHKVEVVELSRMSSKPGSIGRSISHGAIGRSISQGAIGRSTSQGAIGRSTSRGSIVRSISRASSVRAASGRHSFSVPFGLPTGPIEGNGSADAELTSEEPTERTQEVPFRRLATLNKPETPFLLLGVLAASVNGLVYPVFGLLFSIVVKMFFEQEDELRKDSKFWACIFVAMGVVALVSQSATNYFFAVAGCKLIRRIRSLCFEKVVHMEINWFDEPEHSSGSIGARLSADAATIRGLVGDALGLLVKNTASAVSGLVIAFTGNWTLALIVLVMLPLVGFSGYLQMKLTKGFSADAKMLYEEASQIANDAVGSIRTVASFSAEERVMQLYKKKCESPIKAGIRLGLISGLGFGFSYFSLYCVYGTCFYAGARLVDDGKTTFEKVFRVIFALSMAAIGISQSSQLAPDSSKARSSTASIFGILDRKSEIDSSDSSGETKENVVGEIEFRHVSFKYPTRPDVQIFRDLCLSIHSGKTVALVGESGSGKSTVIALLQRFYNPNSGYITLDGVEIQKFQLRWLRQQMGFVSQEPILFNDTIRANIAYGKEGDSTEAEILAAAELANAHNFISGLQQGYDTVVGERGIQLSGGQKQRIAIARAMIKAPKILLLDEATSALDAESERVVQDALDKVMVNRTTVVVAHRLSTIVNADLIAVVRNGVIAEKGKHSSLINIKNGVYASLVALHMNVSSIVIVVS